LFCYHLGMNKKYLFRHAPFLFAALISVSLCDVVFSQSIRFDLGQRLRRLEAELEKDLSESNRVKALQPMEGAVQNFFSGRLDDAAQGLDQAWVQLLPDEQQVLAQWVAGLQIKPVGSLLADGDQFQFQLTQRFATNSKPPTTYEVRCSWQRLSDQGAEEMDEVVLPMQPDRYTLKLKPDSDYLIHVAILSADFEISVGEIAVARIANFYQRLEQLKKRMAAGKKATPPWQASAAATVRQQIRVLEQWSGPNDLETLLMAQQELQRLERIADVAALPDWLASSLTENDQELGNRRLWVKWMGPGRKSAKLRIAIPAGLQGMDKRVPCIIALHGAGGSENMFLDTYGDGKIADLCEKRGWILVSPRIGLGGVGLPMQEVIKQLAEVLPIDSEQVGVVGHSMGAAYSMQLVNEAQNARSDFQYQAVAAVGGGRPTKIANLDAQALQTQFFVAAGSNDFGRGGALGLHNALERQAVDSTWQEYAETEHLGIVQICLEDVFEFFDATLTSKD
ncbi:MAG: hypothetical protein P8J33_13785, partial [Pirellulaceae bacterium]|nr:hypothetical protein [Pirellulaceae bacterium]